MLSVEQRQGLVTVFEAAIAARRQQADARVLPAPQRLDASVRAMVRCEVAEREFYELLNLVTAWSLADAT